MKQAARTWEYVLADPLVVEIDVQEVSILDLPFGAQGGAVPKLYMEVFADFRQAMLLEQTSADDALATQSLPTGERLSFHTWDAERNPVVNAGDDLINHYVLLPRAQLRALGLPVEGVDPDPDAEIRWSDYFLDRVFDYDRSDGVDGTDFLGVAVHEIGHALGFASGADWIDLVHAGLADIPPELIDEFAIVMPLDLFRYSSESPSLIDITPGHDAYFSIDGGTTPLGSFATGEVFGDGWQAGHWRAGSGHGVMAANLPDGEVHNLALLDLRAMDVIGWDLALTGDFDLDGDVDGEDYNEWRVAYGAEGDSLADGNHDGQVDAADYVVWRDRLGTGLGENLLVREVPEPRSLLLAAALATLAANRRRDGTRARCALHNGTYVATSSKSDGSPA